MTQQETFDKIVGALLRQGRPSIAASGECQYRGPDGCRCAIGHVLSDDKYSPRFEGSNIDPSGGDEDTLDLRRILLGEGYDLQLLYDLQIAHDQSVKLDDDNAPIDWLSSFRTEALQVAQKHELSSAILDADHAAPIVP